MPHIRTQLRDGLETQLTGLATPNVVLFEFRHRVDVADMPAVLVSLTNTEPQIGEFTMGSPYEVENQQTVLIEMHATAPTGRACMETLDQLELEIEAALASDLTVGNLLENLWPGTSELEVNVDQDIVAGVRSVSYLAIWRAQFGAADIPEG